MYLSKAIGDYTMEDLGMIAVSGLILFMVITLGLCVIAKVKSQQNKKMPINEGCAKVVGKQPFGNDGNHEWVIFEMDSGNRIRLLCLTRDSHIVGDAGYLKWQGNRFLSFEIGKSSEQVEAK